MRTSAARSGTPGASVSQQPAVRRGRGIVVSERRGTTTMSSVRDPELLQLLDVARRMFDSHLRDTIDLLRLVDNEAVDQASGNSGGPASGGDTASACDSLGAFLNQVRGFWSGPVAELRPYRSAPLSAAVLLRRWRRLPILDAGLLRA